MNRYNILSPEKHIAELLKSDHSAEHRYFNMQVHHNGSEVDDKQGADIVVATEEFWMQQEEWLEHPGCKVCMCDDEICTYAKDKELYGLYTNVVNGRRILSHLTSIYSTFLINESSAKEWKMYYKALVSEPHPIFVTDKNGNLNFMNMKAELEFKVRLKNFRGVLFESLFNISSENDNEALDALVDFYSECEISHSIPKVNAILHTGKKQPYSVALNRVELDNLDESPVKISLTDASYINLIEEELRLKDAAIEQTQNGVMITDSDLEGEGPFIEYVNPQMLEITGYERDELIGKNPRMLQGPKTNKFALKDLKKTISNGDVFKAIAMNYKKDGSEYFVEWSISPIRKKDGKISHYVSIQEDKTDEVEKRKNAEQELLFTSAQLSTIFNHSNQIFILLDKQFQILSFNERATQWAKNLIKKPLLKASRFDEYDTLGFVDDMHRRFNEALNGTASKTERMFETETDKTRWVKVEYIPVSETGNELPDKVLFVATDITDQKKVETELRDSKKLLESINEHVSQGIFRLTNDSWLYANKALLHLLEIDSVTELQKFGAKRFFQSPIEFEEMAHQMRVGDGINNREFQLKNSAGKVYDVLISAFVIDTENGISFVDGTLTDITERKKSELKLRESEKRYRDLYENMSQGVLYHTPDGSIVT
jgi:PAS domain S-box-containing protein